MTKYTVTLPICGHVHVEVEADSQDEAHTKAMDEWKPEDVEWEFYEHAEGFVNTFPDPYYPVIEETEKIPDASEHNEMPERANVST